MSDRRPGDDTPSRGFGAPGFGAPTGGRGFGPPSGAPVPGFGGGPTPSGPAPGAPSFGPPATPAGPGGFGPRPQAPAASGGPGFGDRPGGSVLPETTDAVTAPLGLLALAGGLVAVGLLLAALAHGRPVLAVLAWLLAGFGAIGALGVFTVTDARRRTAPWYTGTASAGLLQAGLAAAAVLVVALASYQFADWLARR